MSTKALTGALSIDLGDGVTLTAASDVALARQWAAHVHGVETWQSMSFGQQSSETAAALRALRLSVAQTNLQLGES